MTSLHHCSFRIHPACSFSPASGSPCLAKLTREYKTRDLDSIPQPLKIPRTSWRLQITSSRSCRCQRFRNSTVAVLFWCDLQLMAEEDPSSLLRTANLDVGFYILRNCKHEFRNKFLIHSKFEVLNSLFLCMLISVLKVTPRCLGCLGV